MSWSYATITSSLSSLMISFLSCSVSLNNLSTTNLYCTVTEGEVFFWVAAMEDLQYLLAFVLVLLKQILVLPHDCFWLLLEVLELGVEHSDLHNMATVLFFSVWGWFNHRRARDGRGIAVGRAQRDNAAKSPQFFTVPSRWLPDRFLISSAATTTHNPAVCLCSW